MISKWTRISASIPAFPERGIDTAGQGQFIDVDAENQFMFMARFTYTDANYDHPFEQRWLTGQGNYAGNVAELVLYETLGGRLDDPQAVMKKEVGIARVTLYDCDESLLAYNLVAEGLQGEFPMIRAIPGSGDFCAWLNGTATQAVNINPGMDGAWYGPNTSGQGWLTVQGGFQGSNAAIDVFETTGGSFDEPKVPNTVKVDTMNIDFSDCNNANVTYSLTDDNAEGEFDITRVIPGTNLTFEVPRI